MDEERQLCVPANEVFQCPGGACSERSREGEHDGHHDQSEQRDTYRIQVVDQRATVNSHVVPTETETVTRYSLRTEERWEWRLMDCEDIELPGYNPPSGGHPPAVAQNRSAPSSQGNTYLYGTDMPVTDDSYSEEVPVAEVSYSTRSRSRAH